MAIKGYWRLNGNSNDASGNGKNGTDTAITYLQANGRINQGAGFNGSTSKILLPNIGLSGATPRTVMAWVSVNSTSLITVYSSGVAVAGSQFVIYINGASTRDVYVALGNNDYYTPTNAVVANVKTHIAVTFAGGTVSTSTIKVYVNGVLKTLTKAGSGTVANTTDSNYAIGYDAPSASRWFNGSIDEVIAEARAWSQAEIKRKIAADKGFF